MREINLCDQSHASWSWGSEISRFGVDYMGQSIRIQNLQGMTETVKCVITSIQYKSIFLNEPKNSDLDFDCCLWILHVFESSIDI